MHRLNTSAWPKWPAKEVHCSSSSPLLFDQNVAKRPCYGPFKLMPSYNINLIGVIILFVWYWPPPATMNAVLATIVAGRQAQYQLNIEVNINILISTLIL